VKTLTGRGNQGRGPITADARAHVAAAGLLSGIRRNTKFSMIQEGGRCGSGERERDGPRTYSREGPNLSAAPATGKGLVQVKKPSERALESEAAEKTPVPAGQDLRREIPT